jgi:PAS domain S-box-containing protein
MDIGARYAWLKLLVDTSFAARFLINSDGRIVYANSAARALFGYTSEELDGALIDLIFLTGQDRKQGMPPLDRPVRIIVGDGQEIRGKTKEGKELTLRVGTSPIHTLTGTFLAVTIFDVTAYREKERELRFRSKQLEEANERISRFAHLVSHDLQEPLRKIASFSTVMKTALSEGDAETALHASDVVQNSASRARSLVASLLDYCSEASAILKLEYIEVRGEVEQVLGDLSVPINETGAKIHDDVPSDLKVKADRAQFMRLLNNLIENAIKFHKVGERPEVVVSASKAERSVRLQVSDKGIGFEPQYAERIFEPFERLQPFSQTPGHGIGLAAVKSICDRHGWSIDAQSLPGQGATFRIDIPIGKGQNCCGR